MHLELLIINRDEEIKASQDELMKLCDSLFGFYKASLEKNEFELIEADSAGLFKRIRVIDNTFDEINGCFLDVYNFLTDITKLVLRPNIAKLEENNDVCLLEAEFDSNGIVKDYSALFSYNSDKKTISLLQCNQNNREKSKAYAALGMGYVDDSLIKSLESMMPAESPRIINTDNIIKDAEDKKNNNHLRKLPKTERIIPMQSQILKRNIGNRYINRKVLHR